MMSISKIWTVAFYEAKILMRGWFLRIFAILAVALLIAENALLLTGSPLSPWAIRTLPSSIPYLNMVFLNIFQAVVAAFLATGFLKRDSVLDTTEVVYIRSMTNMGYVLGKTLGNGMVFVGLNLLVLLVSGLFNYFAVDVPLRLSTYVYYPLLFSIPTLVFTFGLAFLLMVLIGSQPVVLIVLLGSFALSFFFLQNALYHLFDFTGFSLPMLHSDFIGFGSSSFLLQRSMYLLLGLAFIAFTSLRIRRLPQSVLMQRAALAVAIVCGVSGLAAGSIYVSSHAGHKGLRRQMVSLNNQYFGTPRPTPVRYSLEVNHHGRSLSAKAGIVLSNTQDKPLDTYVLRLNPGLEVTAITGSGAVRYTREKHLIHITPAAPLQPGQEDAIAIEYHGTIIDQACYLDISDEDLARAERVLLFRKQNRFGIVSPGYVLLTPESGFYPRCGVGFSSDHPEYERRSLAEFDLKVQAAPALTAVSQGAARQESPGTWTFKPGKPLTGVSLVIGTYVKDSITVDSVQYNLLTLKSHRFFEPYFDQVHDSVPSLIRQIREDYEEDMKMAYAYPRLSLIEVPLQFTGFTRLWTQATEAVQPEMILLAEKGYTLNEADFKHSARGRGWRRRDEGEVLTPAEEQEQRFRRFVDHTFVEGQTGRRFRHRGSDDESIGISLLQSTGLHAVSYALFPLYYRFSTIVNSDKWPLFPVVMETYYRNRSEQQDRRRMFRRMFGMSNEEKVNLALMDLGLDGVLKHPKKKQLAQDAIGSLGTYIFTVLRRELGEETLDSLMQEMLQTYRFRPLDAEKFCSLIQERFQFDLRPTLDACYAKRSLPGFLVERVQAYEFRDSTANRYQVQFEIQNHDSTAGIVVATVRTGSRGGRGRGGRGGRGGGRFGDATEDRIISLGPLESKHVGMIVDQNPRMLLVNTLISRNLPSAVTFMFERVEQKENVLPFDGDTVVVPTPIDEPGVIIVDNEDEGFEVHNLESGGLLQRLFNRDDGDQESEYQNMRRFRPPSSWTATTGPSYYGKFVRSANFVKGGDGDQRIAWNATIDESGTYDVYVYQPALQRMFRRHRGSDDRRPYEYVVHHDDGTENVEFRPGEAEDEWSLLGSYYFSSGKATVELTDRSEEHVVVGDAVKWVKR